VVSDFAVIIEVPAAVAEPGQPPVIVTEELPGEVAPWTGMGTTLVLEEVHDILGNVALFGE